MSRLEWLEEQIKIQEDALVTCPNEAQIHAYLLERLTNEWCELISKQSMQ